MLEIFALIVLAVLCTTAIWLLVVIGNIPGNMARKAAHPQAEAISVLAWLGLLTLGIGWGVALVWAKAKPIVPTVDLERRIRQLETKLDQMEHQQ